MELEERKQIENLDKLIEKQEQLNELTKQPAWDIFMKTLAEMRVDAMDSAIMEGDTTDQKAQARVLGTLINLFYTWSDETLKDDLITRRKVIVDEIRYLEETRRDPVENLNTGLSSTI